ncbi:MAG TPA: hypothetical protein VJS66_05980 [Burkholderiales bacterium]|nr:hypothetical protein [Burkholderiales bacterium]
MHAATVRNIALIILLATVSVHAEWHKLSGLSEGIFGTTFSNVGYLYDYRNGVKPSDDAEIHIRKICKIGSW